MDEARDKPSQNRVDLCVHTEGLHLGSRSRKALLCQKGQYRSVANVRQMNAAEF